MADGPDDENVPSAQFQLLEIGVGGGFAQEALVKGARGLIRLLPGSGRRRSMWG